MTRWWFPLGVLVGGTGVLGSASALRHKAGVDLTKPASGVQYLGVLTGGDWQTTNSDFLYDQ